MYDRVHIMAHRRREPENFRLPFVVFPELWTCGYYLETFDFLAAVKENDKILEQFQALAKETHTVTVLPLPQKKGEDLYIGLYVIESDGRILAEYQKSFLWGREQNYGIMCVCNK